MEGGSVERAIKMIEKYSPKKHYASFWKREIAAINFYGLGLQNGS
jgi:hypothetical protein